MRWFPLLLLCLILPAAHAADPALVSFYECLRCEQSPVLDGRLDDAAWQTLPVMDSFFKYWTPVPQPPPLKTAARLCYDQRGLYLGITMFEDQLDKIRMNVDSRDDPATWHDDCVEIMLDPQNSGSGYMKFTTNFRGARHDLIARNLVLDDGWSVEGWQVRTSRGTDAWFIECFIPWTDLDRQVPREGEIWSFTLVRYGWATGAFRGVSSSLGGSGASPQKFGYLGFGSFAPYTKNLDPLARVIRQTKGNSFTILLPALALTYGADAGWRRQTLVEWVGQMLQRADGQLAAAQSRLSGVPQGADRTRLEKQVGEVADRVAEVKTACLAAGLKPNEAAFANDALSKLARQASEANWEAAVLGLVETNTK